ncbi:YdiU family protein [Uliginosibacterium sp. H3]|uniref:Protein nucleotidyltransferase YdiU n=1 Tax=Uliginosibacterium silvisoli TaxID=3114758 RepID=A0ABU6K550_9RHOO|nr:YdiU family protein [Uliginosibacterium sp. H3]
MTPPAPSESIIASEAWVPQLNFDNSFGRLPASFYTRLAPTPLPAPYLVCASPETAALLGIDIEALADTETARSFAEYFAGNRPLPGSDSLAAVYSGHQFGVWAGQLGDGRAHLLGGVRMPDGIFELQLKGAGETPYSRRADGRAVLRSSIREFLCSEAMAALGIPTTRALCVVGSNYPVRRETMETAAVVTRVAPSFVRFGSFEHWNSLDRDAEVKQLADYVIDNFRPALRDSDKPYEALLTDVAQRTGIMIAHWQAVGFMHGVMNTDNMSILGLTLDYGPFGFMEAFDAAHICNHSDDRGRYAFHQQPRIGHWNLLALTHAMRSLVGPLEEARDIIDKAYVGAFESHFMQLIRAKLGFNTEQPGDEEFFSETFNLLQAQHLDYTSFFRALSHLSGNARDARLDAGLRDQFLDRESGDAWLQQWRERLALEASDDGARQARMLATNPKYILRNWLAEVAIREARGGDFSEVARLLDCLRKPFDEQPHYQSYAALPPDWAAGLEVSCSS